MESALGEACYVAGLEMGERVKQEFTVAAVLFGKGATARGQLTQAPEGLPRAVEQAY